MYCDNRGSAAGTWLVIKGVKSSDLSGELDDGHIAGRVSYGVCLQDERYECSDMLLHSGYGDMTSLTRVRGLRERFMVVYAHH